MRIVINYDLMDKVAEANKGYSLKRCAKRTMGFTSISSAIGAVDNIMNGEICPELFGEIAIYLAIHSAYTGAYVYALSNITKESAIRKLSELVQQLRSSCIKTDEVSILEAYKYKSEYDVQMKSIVPIIEQKKYIKVPIRDDYFGDKEASLVQEHIIGSNEYVLSLGEPEEKKIYSLGYRKMLGR